MPERAIYAILTGDADVSGVVGTRVFPMAAMQEAVTPFITYESIDGEDFDDDGGSTGLMREEFEITCWDDGQRHEGYSVARDLRAKVRAALQHFEGVAGGIGVLNIHWEPFRDDVEKVGQGGQKYAFGVRANFTVVYSE